jgi:hypothetical protein
VHGASIGGGGGGGGNASLAFEKGTLLRSLAINVEVCAHNLRVAGGVAGACLLSVTRRRLLLHPRLAGRREAAEFWPHGWPRGGGGGGAAAARGGGYAHAEEPSY